MNSSQPTETTLAPKFSVEEQYPVEQSLLGVAALKKLKIYQKFDCPDSPELVDNFPLTISPVTSDMVGLLTSLSELSEAIPKDKNYVLYSDLSQVMTYGLRLARELTDTHVKDRKEKMAALAKTIKQVTEIAKDWRHPAKLVDANNDAKEMNKKIVTSKHAYQLMTAIKELTVKAGSPRQNYTSNPVIPGPLSTEEENTLREQQEHLAQEYYHYLNFIKLLRDAKNADSEYQKSAYSVASYEIIKASDHFYEFKELLERLTRLTGYLRYQDKITQPISYQIINNGFQLAFEIGTRKYDMAFNASRKQQITAMIETMDALIMFGNDPNNTAREKLVVCTLKMRDTIEGPYHLTRKENSLLCGLVGATIALLSLTALVSSIVALCILAPVAMPLSVIGLIVTAYTGLATTNAVGISMVVNSFLPSLPKEQDASRNIYQQVVTLNQHTLFKSAAQTDSGFQPARQEYTQPTFTQRA